MIGCIWRFRFSANAFLKGVPAFCWQYLRTRSIVYLLCGLPALFLTAAMARIVLQTDSPEAKSSLSNYYRQLSHSAIESHDLSTAETYFARVLASSSDPKAETFDFATRLFEASGGIENKSFLLNPAEETPGTGQHHQILRRSLTMMQSLAPRQRGSRGYAPAHRFLNEFWHARVPRTDFTQTLALQHAVAAAPMDPKPAMLLAKFVSRRGYHQHAIDVLSPLKDGHAEVLILCAAEHSALQQSDQVIECLSAAESLLAQQLAQDQTDVSVRMSLARVQAARGQLLPSMLLLAQGCQHEASATLIDGLISRYTLWLSLMSPDKVQNQLQEITLALQHSANWDEAHATTERSSLKTSDGQTVLLPGPIVAFHSALLNGEGSWLVPLLLGTDAAAQEDYAAAVPLLRESHQLAPQHPLVANNLAWTLLKQYQARDEPQSDTVALSDAPSKASSEPEQSSLQTASALLSEAWQLANAAVQTDPEILPYRETRGVIAAATGRWQMAIDDLQTCADAGFQSGSLLSTLNRARQQQLDPAE